MIEKAALRAKLQGQAWQPSKRLSPDTLEGLRALHASDPVTYSTPTLAEHFRITPDAVRRILKSKWKPSPDEVEKRAKRWEQRGLRKWEDMASKGIRPPKRWREMGVSESKPTMTGGPSLDRSSMEQDLARQAKAPPTGSMADRVV